jgi:hypothetical protein
VAETYTVMSLYAAITISMVLLSAAAESEWKSMTKRISAIFALVSFGGFFLFTLSVFASKAGGYPYSPF